MQFKNDLFLRAFTDETLPRAPLWLMRQAGRYLPEYRQSRSKFPSFMDACRSSDFCVEVMLQPLARYPLDAAILFSDILTIPDAMNLGLTFGVGEGPRFASPLRDETTIRALRAPDLSSLHYVFDAVSACKRALIDDGVARVPLIGFAGSPFTLACYMIEGAGSSSEFAAVRKMMFQRPDLLKRVLEINTACVIDYLEQQARSGADVLMIFDSWGGVLSPSQYEKFSLTSLQQIASALKQRLPNTPLICFSKGAAQSFSSQAQASVDGLGVDWQSDLSQVRTQVGERITLQGNFDPAICATDAESVRQHVLERWRGFNPNRRYVANLGHGITPDASPELVGALVEAVRKISEKTLDKP